MFCENKKHFRFISSSIHVSGGEGPHVPEGNQLINQLILFLIISPVQYICSTIISYLSIHNSNRYDQHFIFSTSLYR